MNSVELLLEKFDSILQRYNLPNYKKLQEPLPEKEIDNYFASLNIKDSNLRMLYKWKNGFDLFHRLEEFCQIVHFGAILSLESILYEVNNNYKTKFWADSFVPLIADGTGDYLLLNLKHGDEYGKLHLFSPSLLYVENPVSYYDSIVAMIETTIKAYDEKALNYDFVASWLDIDVENYHSIAKNNNVASEYWKNDTREWPKSLI